MTTEPARYILKLACPDRLGIVAAVSGFLAQQDCNVTESAQFNDPTTGLFFLRTVFTAGAASPERSGLVAGFGAIGRRFTMDWEIFDAAVKQRVLILVSRFGHCLNDLLYRWRTDALPMTVTAVASNHPDLQPLAGDLPFHHLPMKPGDKAAQEAALLKLVEETQSDLVVLARYMQILSSDLAAALKGRCINIHHSFLPSFKGAKPYHQAFERGVTLIGATAHYVTESLDEGPIIEQGIERVNHTHTPEELVAIGRDIECQVLARAVRWHCEHRVILNGHKTVVFS